MVSLSQIRPARVEINLDVIARNVKTIMALCRDGAAVMAVVKANGYGHGGVEVARAAVEAGATWLGVAILDEALELRRAGITAPILVMGYTPEEQARRVVENGIAQAVWTAEMVAAMIQASRHAGKPALMHLKIDTGMSRIGVRAGEETRAIARALREAGCERLDGTFTHFAAADENPGVTEHQFAEFKEAVAEMRESGVDPGRLHCCNSAAILKYPQYHLDLVRSGIALYGYPPLPSPGFEIPLTLRARLSYVKSAPAGATIGYGCTYRADREMVIGTVPVGYADGYKWRLGNKAEVSVRGTRVPVVGRVCMDQLMVDLTRVTGARAGDEVVLIAGSSTGAQESPRGEVPAGGGPTAAEIASWAGTMTYDVLAGLSPRLPRVYRKNGDLYMLGAGGERVEVVP